MLIPNHSLNAATLNNFQEVCKKFAGLLILSGKKAGPNSKEFASLELNAKLHMGAKNAAKSGEPHLEFRKVVGKIPEQCCRKKD